MDLIEVVRLLQCEGYVSIPSEGSDEEGYLARITQRLDMLSGHSKLLEACRAVIEDVMPARAHGMSESLDWPCHLCRMEGKHAEYCPVLLCEAAVAKAEPEKAKGGG